MPIAEALSGLKMEKEERPSRLLLLRWERRWPGRSSVQQDEAAECHGEANPPHRCPRLPKEKLAQDGRRDEVGGCRCHRGSSRGGGESQGFRKDRPHDCIAGTHQANAAYAKQHRQPASGTPQGTRPQRQLRRRRRRRPQQPRGRRRYRRPHGGPGRGGGGRSWGGEGKGWALRCSGTLGGVIYKDTA